MTVLSTRRLRLGAAALAASTLVLMMIPATPALATSVVYSAPALSTSADGEIITASTTISASPAVTADKAGVCARNSGGGVVDFPAQSSVPLSVAGTAMSSTRVLSPGTYTYWACAKVSGNWHDIGAKNTLVVIDPGTTPTLPTPVPNPGAADPSGVPMPVGDLPGWHQTFSDDFTTNVAAGGFPGPYASKWMSYNGFADSSGNGDYNQNIISMHDGEMDLNLHTVNGRPQGAAPVPLVDGGAWGGQTYGMFSVRFRSDWLPGYGTGWLLWADSGNWNDGEIDFPEGGLSQTMQAFDHCVGNAAVNCLAVNTGVTYINWHTATVQWSPAGVFYILDGKTVASDTTDIPTKPLHWVLQTGTSGPLPSASESGHVLIDWVSVYSLS